MDKHSHKCGFGIDGFNPEAGCGHEWSHEDSVIVAPDAIYKQAHFCPKCGLGPWTWKSNMPPPGNHRELEDEGMDLVVSLLRLVVSGRRIRCLEK